MKAVRGYYFITDARLSKAGVFSDVRQALAVGVSVVQYRCKDADSRRLYEEARALRTLCRKALFIINDRVDIAAAVGADGVHLGQSDLPYSVARRILGSRAVIGVTVHSLAEALAAARQGADYLGVSPIFTTRTKHDAGRPAGIGLLRRVRRQVKIPLAAIGGITLENAPAVVAAGADAVCAISAVVTKGNVKSQIQKFQRLCAA